MTIIRHRPSHSLDTIATLCEGCEGYWPCEWAGHAGDWTFDGDHRNDRWLCAADCPHPRHDGSTPGPNHAIADSSQSRHKSRDTGSEAPR